jgi:lysophospholipase L1-like esterase
MNKKRTKYIFLTITVLVILTPFLLWKILNAQNSKIYLGNQNYLLQLGYEDLYETSSADIVMLGDSHTYNLNWDELLNRKGIINRGIDADITQGYLNRLKYIYKLNPKICFVEGGINDLYSGFRVQEIFDNYKEIIEVLKNHKITPVIQSTLFVANTYASAKETNKKVEELNQMLINYAKENQIEYLDVNLLVSNKGFLNEELSYDGLHLNAKGYELWKPLVEMVLKKHNL